MMTRKALYLINTYVLQISTLDFPGKTESCIEILKLHIRRYSMLFKF